MINISECVLEHALTNKCVITIMYMKDLEIIQRNVKVIKIDENNIKVIDLDKCGIRTFKRENILSAMKSNR